MDIYSEKEIVLGNKKLTVEYDFLEALHLCLETDRYADILDETLYWEIYESPLGRILEFSMNRVLVGYYDFLGLDVETLYVSDWETLDSIMDNTMWKVTELNHKVGNEVLYNTDKVVDLLSEYMKETVRQINEGVAV